MDERELRALVPGDRVKLATPAGTSHGTVESKVRGVICIRWDGSRCRWSINPRANLDRLKATNLTRDV